MALSKVKGHATALDVRRGRVSARDKHGNDGADHLATAAAAAANSLPQQVVEEALHRKQVVRDVQLMMIEILSARSKQACPSSASSDHGESMSCTSCTESSSTLAESESDFSCSTSDSSSSVQSSVALHNGSNHPT